LSFLLLVGGTASLGALTAMRAADSVNGVCAVSSTVSKDYVRTRLPDGSFQPEYYAFGRGGVWGGEIRDATIDQLGFTEVAREIAPSLASQNYLPAKDPGKATLLLMVYWGTTAVPPRPEEDHGYQLYYQDLGEYQILMSQGDVVDAYAVLSSGLHALNMANHERDLIDIRNAAMIGYDASGKIGTDYGRNIAHTALGVDQRDQVAEIEENRYFVVLMAYDFQLMWKQKKHRLLWQTRFSISERHNQFDQALPVMAQLASRYFGRNSDGLSRARVPEGRVEVGEPKSLGEVPAK
jgi:hypothetical protein